jgi:hypothetical protein
MRVWRFGPDGRKINALPGHRAPKALPHLKAASYNLELLVFLEETLGYIVLSLQFGWRPDYLRGTCRTVFRSKKQKIKQTRRHANEEETHVQLADCAFR